MVNYRRHIEEHLLPAFEAVFLTDMLAADVDAWEKAEKAAGYAATSVKTWRTMLHTILAAAIEDGLLSSNPATRRRGTGGRAGRSAGRGPEKAVTDPLGALLIAERAAVLAGRDDEFVFISLLFWTGMRWAEGVGLQTRYARLPSIRIEEQLYELDPGGLVCCPPEGRLLPGRQHPALAVQAGLRARRADRAKAMPLPRAGLRVPRTVRRGTLAPLGVRRLGIRARRVRWFPKKAPQPRRPVPLQPDPWPGRPVRGRNSQGRAEMSWLPIAAGLTPHSLRHAHKTLMAGLRTPEFLSHDRLGHHLGGIAGRYSHVTPEMRRELLGQLTERWEQALDARAALADGSPVGVLDAALRSRHAETRGTKIFSRHSPGLDITEVIPLRARPRKGA